MADVVITLRPDGPMHVVGSIEIRDMEGNVTELDHSEGCYYLCRCGRSRKKPFCDGAHKRTGWKESPEPQVTTENPKL